MTSQASERIMADMEKKMTMDAIEMFTRNAEVFSFVADRVEFTTACFCSLGVLVGVIGTELLFFGMTEEQLAEIMSLWTKRTIICHREDVAARATK